MTTETISAAFLKSSLNDGTRPVTSFERLVVLAIFVFFAAVIGNFLDIVPLLHTAYALSICAGAFELDNIR